MELRKLALLLVIWFVAGDLNAQDARAMKNAGPCGQTCPVPDARLLQIEYDSPNTNPRWKAKLMEILQRHTIGNSTDWGAAKSEYIAWRNADERYELSGPRPPVISSSSEDSAATYGAVSTDEECLRFGFAAGTADFANCRLQLELAYRDAARDQREYELLERQYREQLMQFEAAEKASQEAERRRRSDYLMRVSQGLLKGETFAEADMAARGTPLPRPKAPPVPSVRRVSLPNGKSVTCSGTGYYVYCY